MDLHLDCSTLEGWSIDNSESPSFNVSTDGVKIYVNDGPFTEGDNALSLYATKPVAVSGDFDITCNITMPDTEAFKDYVDLNFDIFIDFDSPIYNSDASKSAGYVCFRYSAYKVGAVYSPRTIYLQNLQPASEGVDISASLPWTGNLRLARVSGILTAYVDSTVLWTSTHDNSAPNIVDINPDWGTLAKSNYPVTCPNMSINDINILNSTTPPGNITNYALGTNVNGAFNDATGALTVTGTGAMDLATATTLDAIRTAILSVVIESGVTTVANSLFKNCTNLANVSLPEGMTTIEYYSFKGTALTSIAIPSTVTSLSGNSNGCLPTTLTSITFASGMTKIPNYACCGATGLATVTMPSTIVEIGINAFDGCSSLSSIALHEGITAIGYYSFKGTALTSVVIPSTVTTFNSSAIQTFPPTLTTITFANGMTKIPQGACAVATGLTTVNMPSSVIDIGTSAFDGCSSLSSITLHEGITTISYYAFKNCTSLTSITIPSTLTSAGANSSPVFGGCTNLTAVTFASGMTKIPGYICHSIPALTTINIPSTVTELGNYAFYGCSGFTSVTLPNSLTKIGTETFRNCTNLSSVTLPEGLVTIEGRAFNSTGITSITIPSTVGYIGNDTFPAFGGCVSLTSVIFAPGMTNIPNYACKSMAALTSVTIPDSVVNMGTTAFANCTALVSITLPPNLTHIDTYAFQGDTALVSVTIPNSVTDIQSYAFDGCTNLELASLPTGLTSLGWCAFRGCTKMTSIMIPKTLTSVASASYSWSAWGAAMTSITFESGATSIPARACMGSNIVSILIPSTVTTIGASAFKDCTSLTSITNNYKGNQTINTDAFANNTALNKTASAYTANANFITAAKAQSYTVSLIDILASTSQYFYDQLVLPVPTMSSQYFYSNFIKAAFASMSFFDNVGILITPTGVSGLSFYDYVIQAGNKRALSFYDNIKFADAAMTTRSTYFYDNIKFADLSKIGRGLYFYDEITPDYRPRPTDFDGFTWITHGGDIFDYKVVTVDGEARIEAYIVSAEEWNAFTAKVNEFRNYKYLEQYGFTQAEKDMIFTEEIMEEAIAAINEIGNSIPMDPQRFTNELFVTALKSNLNATE